MLFATHATSSGFRTVSSLTTSLKGSNISRTSISGSINKPKSIRSVEDFGGKLRHGSISFLTEVGMNDVDTLVVLVGDSRLMTEDLFELVPLVALLLILF